MLHFLNSDYVGGFVTALTLISFAIAAVRWKKQHASKITFTSKSAPIFVGIAPNGYTASVSGNGKTGSSLFRTLVLISNRTQVTVTDEDFVILPSIPLKEGGVIYDIRLIKEFNGSANLFLVDDDRFRLSKLVIPSNEAIAFEILHDGSVIERIEAMPKSIPNIRNRSLSKSEGLDFSILVLITIILVLAFDIFNRIDSFLNLPKEESYTAALVMFILMCFSFLIPSLLTFFINQTGIPAKLSYRIWGYSKSEAKFSEMTAEKQPLLHEILRPEIALQSPEKQVKMRVQTKV